MREKLNRNNWTNVTTTTVDTLVSAEGDLRIHTVADGGAAPVDLNDGHVFLHGQALVVPTGLDVYAIAEGNTADIVFTDFGV